MGCFYVRIHFWKIIKVKICAWVKTNLAEFAFVSKKKKNVYKNIKARKRKWIFSLQDFLWHADTFTFKIKKFIIVFESEVRYISYRPLDFSAHNNRFTKTSLYFLSFLFDHYYLYFPYHVCFWFFQFGILSVWNSRNTNIKKKNCYIV